MDVSEHKHKIQSTVSINFICTFLRCSHVTSMSQYVTKCHPHAAHTTELSLVVHFRIQIAQEVCLCKHCVQVGHVYRYKVHTSSYVCTQLHLRAMLHPPILPVTKYFQPTFFYVVFFYGKTNICREHSRIAYVTWPHDLFQSLWKGVNISKQVFGWFQACIACELTNKREIKHTIAMQSVKRQLLFTTNFVFTTIEAVFHNLML